MKNKFLINLLTPNNAVLQKEVSMVLLPGNDGELGILPEHISLIIYLEPGIVKIFSNNKLEDQLFISGGFAKFHNNQLNILADSSSEIGDLDDKTAKEEIPILEEELMSSEDTEYLQSLFKKILLQRKIIEIVQRYKK